MSGFGDRMKNNTALRVLAVYLGASWVVLQVVDVVKQNMGLPDWVFPFAVVLLVIGALSGYLPLFLGIVAAGSAITAIQRVAMAYREMAQVDAAAQGEET